MQTKKVRAFLNKFVPLKSQLNINKTQKTLEKFHTKIKSIFAFGVRTSCRHCGFNLLRISHSNWSIMKSITDWNANNSNNLPKYFTITCSTIQRILWKNKWKMCLGKKITSESFGKSHEKFILAFARSNKVKWRQRRQKKERGETTKCFTARSIDSSCCCSSCCCLQLCVYANNWETSWQLWLTLCHLCGGEHFVLPKRFMGFCNFNWIESPPAAPFWPSST